MCFKQCPVCLLVLKEPCLISCCGHKFCRECIERIDENPCPLCSESDFTFLRERGLERSLKELEVWCSYRKEGCEWKGKLGKLEEHLNRDLFPENRLNGCQFVALECKHNKCGAWFQRPHITTHETQQCKKRPYSCNYCRNYHSTFEDVTEVHYPQCCKYPVACPNGCDVYKIERQNVEIHLKEQCPLALVDCSFHFAGCETRLPRKDMPEHMKESVIHLTLLATATQKFSTENQRLVKENQELQQRMIERDDELQKLDEKHSTAVKSNEEIAKKLQTTEDEVRALKEGVQKQELKLQQLVNHLGFPIDYYVKQTRKDVYLPAFYTHPHGYRMRVYVRLNGMEAGEGTHVSIFIYIHIIKGPFDDYLKWPFRGEITIQIVNQVGDHDHVEWVIDYTDRTPDDNAGRVMGKKRAEGWGYNQLLAHNELQYNAERKTQYLKDNDLHIRVVKVKLC